MIFKNIFTSLLAIFLTLLAVLAYGDEVRSIRVNYEDTNSGNAAYYRVYKNNVLVCENFNTEVMYVDCDVLLSQTPALFTLTVVDHDNVESPHSTPFPLRLPPQDEFGNYLPTISLETDVVSGTTPLTVDFDASLSKDLDGSIVYYQWDFADGSVGNGAITSHIFDSPGVFDVTLTIIDNTGGIVNASKSITVTEGSTSSGNILPAAAINIPVNIELTFPVVIDFDALDSSDSDGAIQTYSWDFGDGSTGSGISIIHEYVAAGDYTVTLSVIDDEGGFSFDQMVISIIDDPGTGNAPPEPVISASVTQRQIHFEWEYTPVDTIPAGFRLYQNNNLVCEVEGADIRQMDCNAFVEEGLVELFLTAYFSNQTETSISNVLAFDSTGIYPTVNEGNAPLNVQFNGNLSYDPDGYITSSEWDFGDGQTAIGSVVQHTFTIGGIYTVTHSVADNLGAVAQVSTTIHVVSPGKAATPTDASPANAVPVAHDGSLTVNQDSKVVATLYASDTDNLDLQYRIVRNGVIGSVELADPATGNFTYTPNGDAAGADTFTFVANDGVVDSNIATITVTVNAVNKPPVAVDDVATGEENSTLLIDVLDNDYDPEGAILIISSITPPANGTAVITNGKIEYTPNTGYFGADSITYIIDDGNGGTASAVVNITVTQLQYAVTLTWEYPDEIGLTGFKIYYNGASVCETSDPAVRQITCLIPANNDPKSFSLTSLSTSYLESEESNTISYDPAQTFTPNNAPTAGADSVTVQANNSIIIDVLANDSDSDGDVLTIDTVSSVGTGTVINNGNHIIYTPTLGYVGAESFSYTVLDGKGGIATGIVTVAVIPVQKEITFFWDYQGGTATNGFRLYLNNSPICETNDPNARQLTCLIDPITGPLAFTMKSLELGGTESGNSNAINYTP